MLITVKTGDFENFFFMNLKPFESVELAGSESAVGRGRDALDRLLFVDWVWRGMRVRALEKQEKFHGGRVVVAVFWIFAVGSDIQTGMPKTFQKHQNSGRTQGRLPYMSLSEE